MEKSLFIFVPYNEPERAKEILAEAQSFSPRELSGLSVFVNNFPPRPRIIIAAVYTADKVLKGTSNNRFLISIGSLSMN